MGFTAHGQTLDESIQAALDNSPTMESARARLEGAEAGVVISRSEGKPSVDGSLRYTRDFNTAYQTSDGLGADASLSIPLFRGGSVRNGVKAAEARRDASTIGIDEAETQVFLATASAYADILRDRRIVGLHRENVANLATMLEGVKKRLGEHDLTRTDLDQAQSRLALARSRLESARANLETSEVEFQRLTGQRPGEIAPFPEVAGIPPAADAAVDAAVSENPAIKGARMGAQSERFALNSARGDLLPQIYATANGTYVSSPAVLANGNRDNFGATVGVSMRMSLFQGGRKSAGVRQASARVSEAEQRLIDLERNVTARTRASHAAWLATREVVAASKEAVAANRQALDGVRRENEVGTRTILDILNAEQELRDAQIQQANAERDASVSAVAVLAAMGRTRVEAMVSPAAASENPGTPVAGAGTVAPHIAPQSLAEDSPARELPALAEPAASKAPPLPPAKPVLAAAKPAPSPTPPPSLSSPESWSVQLGALEGVAEAKAQWSRLRAKVLAVAPAARPAIFKATITGQDWYRLAIPGGGDWDQAQATCLKLKNAGLTCLVRRSGTLGSLAWSYIPEPARGARAPSTPAVEQPN